MTERSVEPGAQLGALLAGVMGMLAAGGALAGNSDYLLAANNEVLQQWAQTSGTAAPQLVEAADEDGGTRLEWTTSVSYDYYQNNSRGGFTLTPIREESSNNTGQVQTEARSTSSDGAVSWLTFGATFSDDRAVLDHPTLINNLQFGHAAERYRVAFGDVPVGFSTLGTNTGLRGLFGEGYLGATLFQAVAGVQSDTWESIASEERRTRYLRNSYAFKVEQPFGESFSTYVTTQGYADDDDEDTAATTGLAPADGNATTLGFNFRQGGFTLSAEGGVSDGEEEGYADESDEAWIVDASWQGERIGLQAGYHDLGLYYTSLSGDALSGVSEAYGNINWMASSWLSLTGDLRHTENERAEPPPGLEPPITVPYSPNAVEADSWTLGANVAILAVDGLNLQFSHAQSDGENDGGSENDQQDSAANLQFNRGGWSTGLGYQRGDYENAAAPGTDSKTEGWNAFVGREWAEPVSGDWSIGTMLMYADQRQELDTGPRNTNESYQLSINGQHVRFGQFSAMWYDGRVRDPSSGQHLDQRGIQLEAGRALGRYGSFKVYYSRNDSFEDRSDIAYMERTLGMQFMSTF
jgi:hypothetical protein